MLYQTPSCQHSKKRYLPSPSRPPPLLSLNKYISELLLGFSKTMWMTTCKEICCVLAQQNCKLHRSLKRRETDTVCHHLVTLHKVEKKKKVLEDYLWEIEIMMKCMRETEFILQAEDYKWQGHELLLRVSSDLPWFHCTHKQQHI